jgi:cytochrome c oxidase assembly protein subunit 15
VTTASPVPLPQTRSTRTVRGVYIANLVAQAGIVLTGAVVRVTESGLGCPTWPECVDGSIAPTAEQAQTWHKYIEFGNRLLTFILLALAIAAIVAGFLDRRRRVRASQAPRSSLLVLSAVPLLGTAMQAILGGITVLTGLHPLTVGAHFLVSMIVIAGVVALVVRSGDTGDQPITFLSPRPVRVLAWLLVAVSAIVVILGVVVTGTGPHSGDAAAERLGLDPRTMSWVHADVVLLFLGLLAGLLVALSIAPSSNSARRRAWLLLAIAVSQGIVGYTQYFTGLPEVLVIVHVLGALGVWITCLFIPPALRTRGVPTSS